MSPRTLLFIAFFVVCSGGALLSPIIGVIGYMLVYCLGPERQWWHDPLKGLGIRYSLAFGLITAVGMAINWRKLRYGKSFLSGQEWLILLFLAMVWLSVALGEPIVSPDSSGDHVSLKLAKVVLFVFMLTHVVTDVNSLDRVLWVLFAGTLFLGLQAYGAPAGAFEAGRLETVGGPDFTGSNRLGCFMAGMLFLIGVRFLLSGWKGKLVCLVAGALAANTIVLTRSRGALLAVIAGMVVCLLMAPKKHRGMVIAGVILACLGGIYLMDAGFKERMKTITASEEERDASTQSRIEIWRTGGKMLWSHPLRGVGAGNFTHTIGQYNPEHEGRDAHNTYVTCAAEYGFPGIALFLVLMANGGRLLWRVWKRAAELPEKEGNFVLGLSCGFLASLAAYAVYGMTGTLLYFEAMWWMLAIPVCLSRAVENALGVRGTSDLVREAAKSRARRVLANREPCQLGVPEHPAHDRAR